MFDTKTWPRSLPKLGQDQDIYGDILKRDRWINIRHFDYNTYFQLKEDYNSFTVVGNLTKIFAHVAKSSIQAFFICILKSLVYEDTLTNDQICLFVWSWGSLQLSYSFFSLFELGDPGSIQTLGYYFFSFWSTLLGYFYFLVNLELHVTFVQISLRYFFFVTTLWELSAIWIHFERDGLF